MDESLFPNIKPMENYRDAAQCYGRFPAQVYLETETVPGDAGAVTEILLFESYKSVEPYIAAVRAIKSPYELELMKASGRIHQKVLEESSQCFTGRNE